MSLQLREQSGLHMLEWCHIAVLVVSERLIEPKLLGGTAKSEDQCERAELGATCEMTKDRHWK